MMSAINGGMGKMDLLKTKLKIVLLEIADTEEVATYDLRTVVDDCLLELSDQMAAELTRDRSHLRLVQ
jgi:hypothetical protein